MSQNDLKRGDFSISGERVHNTISLALLNNPPPFSQPNEGPPPRVGCMELPIHIPKGVMTVETPAFDLQIQTNEDFLDRREHDLPSFFYFSLHGHDVHF
jgi:hypothetical protein